VVLFTYGGHNPVLGSQTDRTVVLFLPATSTEIVVTPRGPAVVAKPFASTLAIEVLLDDHFPEELAILWDVRLLYQP